MSIKWMNIERFGGKYSISENSDIRNNETGKILKQTINKGGYSTVVIKPTGRNGRCFCLKIHREFAKLFIPNPNNKPNINHIDGNKLNNHVKNLEWCTQKENVIHAYNNGLASPPIGEKHGRSKLTEENVAFILESKEKTGILATRFGVNHSTISRVRNGQQWKHCI